MSYKVSNDSQTIRGIQSLGKVPSYVFHTLKVESIIVMAPHVEAFPTRVTFPHNVSGPTMFVDEYKIYDRFIRLGPHKYSGAISDDTHEFL